MKYLEVTDEFIETFLAFDSFKMFGPVIHKMRDHFKLTEYQDCVEVTHPSEKLTLYVLITGVVHIIADEKVVKKANFEVRKARRKRTKKAEKDKAEGNKPTEEE